MSYKPINALAEALGLELGEYFRIPELANSEKDYLYSLLSTGVAYRKSGEIADISTDEEAAMLVFKLALGEYHVVSCTLKEDEYFLLKSFGDKYTTIEKKSSVPAVVLYTVTSDGSTCPEEITPVADTIVEKDGAVVISTDVFSFEKLPEDTPKDVQQLFEEYNKF